MSGLFFFFAGLKLVTLFLHCYGDTLWALCKIVLDLCGCCRSKRKLRTEERIVHDLQYELIHRKPPDVPEAKSRHAQRRTAQRLKQQNAKRDQLTAELWTQTFGDEAERDGKR